MNTTKELTAKVFKAMVRLIEKKGDKKKMVSVFDIHDFLKEYNIVTTKIAIEETLDLLIQQKLIRYYRNEKRYIYFGITEIGWAKYCQYIVRTAQPQQEVATTVSSDAKEQTIEEFIASQQDPEKRRLLQSILDAYDEAHDIKIV